MKEEGRKKKRGSEEKGVNRGRKVKKKGKREKRKEKPSEARFDNGKQGNSEGECLVLKKMHENY